MSFNQDPSKKETELLFSRKRGYEDHPDLIFNGSVVNNAVVYFRCMPIWASKCKNSPVRTKLCLSEKKNQYNFLRQAKSFNHIH